MTNIKAISNHAFERWIQRAGVQRVNKALNKLWELAERSKQIKGYRYYSNGWVMVIKDGVVHTVYRPDRPEVKDQIFNAMNQQTK